jgi:cytochrome c peroxidase
MPAPPRAAPADAALVARGQAVFGASCEGCHKSGGSNGLGYDVGTGNPRERPPITGAECVKCHKSPAEEAPKKDRAVIFDTPTLRAVRGSAPYFHDGRYATLDEMLSARDSRMIPSPLSDGDRAALVAYLETL